MWGAFDHMWGEGFPYPLHSCSSYCCVQRTCITDICNVYTLLIPTASIIIILNNNFTFALRSQKCARYINLFKSKCCVKSVTYDINPVNSSFFFSFSILLLARINLYTRKLLIMNTKWTELCMPCDFCLFSVEKILEQRCSHIARRLFRRWHNTVRNLDISW